jgi:hypothetical protein
LKATIRQRRSEVAGCSHTPMAFMPLSRLGTRCFGASLPMRISASWFGSTVGSTAWKDVATIGHWKRAPPRVVFSSLCRFPRGYCPLVVVPPGKKEGCDRPVLARFDLAVAISGIVRPGIVRLSVAAGRDQDQAKHPRAVRGGRNEGRSLPSALPGCSARSLCFLPHHTD